MAKRFLIALNFALGLPFLLCLFLIGERITKQEKIPRQGGVLRVNPFTPGPFQPQLDPLAGAPVFVINQLYDGLVRLDNKLNVIPSLAEYWTISEDGRSYIFYLRKGVKFHHGREVEAEDVKFSLERVIREKAALPFAQYFTSRVVGALEYHQGQADEVEGYKVLGPNVFEIQWKNPYVSGLYLLSMAFCKILPRDLVLSQGKRFFQKPSGTGPFKFAHWMRSPRLDIVGVRLERNEGYFGQKPHLEAIEFSPYFTLEHFLDGEVHIIPYVSDKLSKLDCQVLENTNFTTTFLTLSCHIPPLNRISFRRAIQLAIDKKELARAAFRLDMVPQVTDNFIPARLPGFFPADERDRYNPVEAKKILFEEGFLESSDFPVFLLYFDLAKKGEGDLPIFRALRDQLAELGIQLKMKYYRSLSELRACREPYFVFWEWRMDFPDPENLISPLFASAAVINQELMHFSSNPLDELLKKAEIERSWSERILLFQRIEKILNEEVPALPLFSQQQRLAVQPYVQGIRIPALGFFYVTGEEIWFDK
ncbi:MAG: ABC transporter substrate-binding protein [Candidatus Aminicenantales bacterium]